MKEIFKTVALSTLIAVSSLAITNCSNGKSSSHKDDPAQDLPNDEAIIGVDITGKPGDITYFDTTNKFNFFKETTLKEIIIDAAEIPNKTDLEYIGDTSIPTRIRIKGTYDVGVKGRISITNAVLAMDDVIGTISDDSVEPDITVTAPTDGTFDGIRHFTATSVANEVVIDTDDNNTLVNKNYDYSKEALRIATVEGDVAADIQPNSITNPFNISSYPFRLITVLDEQVEEGRIYYIKKETNDNTKIDIASKNNITVYSDKIAIGTGYIGINNKFYINVDAQYEFNDPVTGSLLRNTPTEEVWKSIPVFTSNNIADDTKVKTTLGCTQDVNGVKLLIPRSRME